MPPSTAPGGSITSPVVLRDKAAKSQPGRRPAVSLAAVLLAVVPLAFGFLTYLTAGARGIAVADETLEVYVVAGLILLMPILAFGVPLVLLLARYFGRLVWLAVLAGEAVVVGLSLSAGPSLEAVGFAYTVAVALWVVFVGPAAAALEPSHAEIAANEYPAPVRGYASVGEPFLPGAVAQPTRAE